MYQFYVVEIQQYANGEFGHIVHFAYDADPDIARNKGDSKYYEVMSAAAISTLPSHAAILFSSEGFPLMHGCYKHAAAPAAAGDTNTTEPDEPDTSGEDTSE